MNLSSLNKITTKKKKRVGLGHGSGRGKTSGRGQKGLKARGDVPLDFEGGALPLIKRLPLLRGKGRNKAIKGKPAILNVSALNVFGKDETVNVETLVKHKLVAVEAVQENGVKILGDGELGVALKVTVPVSKGAAEKITKAGGSIEA